MHLKPPTRAIFKSPFVFSLPLTVVTILPSKNNIFEVSLSTFLFFCHILRFYSIDLE